MPGDAGIPLSLIRAMVATESLVPVGEGIVFLPERIEEGKAILLAALETNSSISLAEYRDLLGASRKYTQALLEYFDGQRITRRAGDRRVAARSVQRMEDDSAR
jgi:selenocysteine-specific elongation factor